MREYVVNDCDVQESGVERCFVFFCVIVFFFFNDPAPTEIYTLSLHDALPIFVEVVFLHQRQFDFLQRKSLHKLARIIPRHVRAK